MSRTDLQVGNIYTQPEARRQGLALAAMNRIREKFTGRRLWYFSSAGNTASLKLAQAASFEPVGEISVSRFLGFGLRYSALAPYPSGPAHRR